MLNAAEKKLLETRIKNGVTNVQKEFGGESEPVRLYSSTIVIMILFLVSYTDTSVILMKNNSSFSCIYRVYDKIA